MLWWLQCVLLKAWETAFKMFAVLMFFKEITRM
jgi:hypothetical protein